MSGQGALMMVLGEPGIGKTALCEQLATYVTLRGGRALVGHCYEEGSLSLPYLAFVEALRSYVLSREVKELREELGKLRVEINEEKSRIVDLRGGGSFGFLGFEFQGCIRTGEDPGGERSFGPYPIF
jgi:predicted ATPase